MKEVILKIIIITLEGEVFISISSIVNHQILLINLATVNGCRNKAYTKRIIAATLTHKQILWLQKQLFLVIHEPILHLF